MLGADLRRPRPAGAVRRRTPGDWCCCRTSTASAPPTCPTRRGLLHGLTRANATPAHLARAAVEGMLCGLADARRRRSRPPGVTPRRILLIGGAARSAAVQRDRGRPLRAAGRACPSPAEYVALGAARQAAWTLSQDDAAPRWKRDASVVEPDAAAAGYYERVRASYSSVLDGAQPLLRG